MCLFPYSSMGISVFAWTRIIVLSRLYFLSPAQRKCRGHGRHGHRTHAEWCSYSLLTNLRSAGEKSVMNFSATPTITRGRPGISTPLIEAYFLHVAVEFSPTHRPTKDQLPLLDPGQKGVTYKAYLYLRWLLLHRSVTQWGKQCLATVTLYFLSAGM